MITLKNISKSYGEVTAVKRVDLEIPQGCIYGIIGRSGAGKIESFASDELVGNSRHGRGALQRTAC